MRDIRKHKIFHKDEDIHHCQRQSQGSKPKKYVDDDDDTKRVNELNIVSLLDCFWFWIVQPSSYSLSS